MWTGYILTKTKTINMKRIPFTIEAWKAGGVPVTRSGEYVKQLTWFEDLCKTVYQMRGVLNEKLVAWTIDGRVFATLSEDDLDLFLEVPCTKHYTHYYRGNYGGITSLTNKETTHLSIGSLYTYIKTVEVEL